MILLVQSPDIRVLIIGSFLLYSKNLARLACLDLVPYCSPCFSPQNPSHFSAQVQSRLPAQYAQPLQPYLLTLVEI